MRVSTFTGRPYVWTEAELRVIRAGAHVRLFVEPRSWRVCTGAHAYPRGVYVCPCVR